MSVESKQSLQGHFAEYAVFKCKNNVKTISIKHCMNRWVLSKRLKALSDEQRRISSGRLFHARGPGDDGDKILINCDVSYITYSM